MSWFDEQIHKRDLSDQEIMEDSLLHIASAVLGRGKARKLQDKQTAAQDALEEILNYYHIQSSGIPEEGRCCRMTLTVSSVRIETEAEGLPYSSWNCSRSARRSSSVMIT